MKILIVDDEPLIRRPLRKLFEGRGHTVMEAANGLEGLDALQSFFPDIVFLDVVMPGLTGPQVVEQIPGNCEARVFLMSAFSENKLDSLIQSKKIEAFIKKPFENIVNLLSLIEGESPKECL
ncbi:MAG: response regulator [Bdellovibrionales bacterium CG10_big_fil_rev_8_21_14_0_10_45_34]|nr:MAG: response regulator [Bdellovibrionales bacterium CG10_big_fil_rev_8_21_14_0_10_45_34]